MTRVSDGDLDGALRRALKPAAQHAPLPDGTEAIPEGWIRPVRLASRLTQIVAPLAVAMIAAGSTWAALAWLDGAPNAPLTPGATLAPDPSHTPETSLAPDRSALPSATSEFELPPPQIDLPPAVTIGGVAGAPVSWCYGRGCADGAHVGPVEGLPAAQSLGPVEVGAEFEEMYARVFASDGASADVPVTGMEIGPLPDGPWERLQISVWFGRGSDATYTWRLAIDNP